MRFLLVEDDPISQKVMVLYLSRYGEVDTAQTLDEAKKKFNCANCSREHPCYDLVLLDINLPDGLGTQLLDEAIQCRRCPVVIVSGVRDPSGVLAACGKRIVEFIPKPVSIYMIDHMMVRLGLVLAPQELPEGMDKTPLYQRVSRQLEAEDHLIFRP